MSTTPYSNRYRLQRAIMRLSGLLAYYPLNEAEGSIARNYAPASRGTIDGTIVGPTVGQPGRAGRAYSFDGVNDVVTLGNGISVKNQSTVTIGAIINVQPGTTLRRIYQELTNSAGFTSRLALQLQTTETIEVIARAADGESLQTKATSSPLAAGYHLVVGVIDIANDSIAIYVDGVSVSVGGTISFTATAISDTNPFSVPTIGARTSAAATYTDFFDSTIQHVFLTRSLLSATEILRLARIAGFA